MLAGGTDWIVDRHLLPVEKATPLDQVIDLTSIDSLATIAFRAIDGERWLSLGGGVTYWALRRDARVVGTIPMVSVMARDVGAVQIQTRGTLGGNIASASPAADGVPALMALGGVVVLASTAGERRVALDSFFTAYRKTVMRPDELIAAIEVRILKEGALVTWRKVGTRLAQAISKVALAGAIEQSADGVVTRARFGMASVAPVIVPLEGVQRAVEGKALASITRADVDAAVASDVTPIDDVRSTGRTGCTWRRRWCGERCVRSSAIVRGRRRAPCCGSRLPRPERAPPSDFPCCAGRGASGASMGTRGCVDSITVHSPCWKSTRASGSMARAPTAIIVPSGEWRMAYLKRVRSYSGRKRYESPSTRAYSVDHWARLKTGDAGAWEKSKNPRPPSRATMCPTPLSGRNIW